MENTRIIILFLLLSFAGQGLESPYIPHEDPSDLREVISPLWLLYWYGDILHFIAMENYSGALRLLEESHRIYILSDLRYLMERLNDLMSKLNGELNETDVLLSEAQRFMEAYRLEEMRGKLEEAGISLGKANITLGELSKAIDEVSRRMGVLSAPPGSDLRVFYERIRELMDEIKELLKRYLEFLRESSKETSLLQSGVLKPTRISLSLNQTYVFVGRFVEAYGLLTSEGDPLSNRTIQIFLEDELVASSKTDGNGGFSITFRVPYLYVERLGCRAVFIPVGGDLGVYSANESDVVEIYPLFYRVSIEASHPMEGYPGRWFNITGRVLTEEGMPRSSLSVMAHLAGATSSAVSGDEGHFSISLRILEDVSVGSYPLVMESHSFDVYAPGRYIKIIDVVRGGVWLEVEAPGYLMLPSILRVEGRVSSQLPLESAVIHLRLWRLENYTEIDEEGSFKCSLRVPLLNIIFGFYRLEVNVEPREPWNERVSTRRSIFLVNPLNISLALMFSITLLYLAPRGRVGGKIRERGEAPVEATLVGERIVAHLPPYAVEERLNPILVAYLRALDFVVEFTGLKSHPSETLREFWSRISPRLKDRSRAFYELTRLAEVVLYSREGPSEEDVGRAQELVEMLEGLSLEN